MIYAPAITDLLRAVDVRAVAHVTGGGLAGNLSRVIPEDCDAVIDSRHWEVPRIFTEIQRVGAVAASEMERVFNLGIGMVVVVPPSEAFRTLDLLRARTHRAVEIGEVTSGSGSVRIVGNS